MGRKINPIIFRQSITKPEIASWVSPKDKFFHLQHQDLEIRNFLSDLLKSRGILLRSCKISRSSQKLQLYLDFYFSYILSKQAKFVWARSTFRTIKKKYDTIYKMRDLKDFIQEAEFGDVEDVDDIDDIDQLNSYSSLRTLKRKKYSLSSLKRKKYFLQKRKKNFIFGTKVLSYKHRYLFFLLLKQKKNHPLINKIDEEEYEYSALNSVKNSLKSNLHRFRFSKLKKIFLLKKIRSSFSTYQLKSSLKGCKRDKKTKSTLLYLNKTLCQSLHNFTGFETINLKIYSTQLNYLPSFKLHKKSLESKLFFLQRNKNLKKYFSESLETLYFVMSTFGYGNAYLLSKLVAYMIENNRKHTLITRFLKKSLEVFFECLPTRFFAIEGIRILVKGRFNKRRRTKTIVVQKGEISLQTIKTPIDYHQTQAITIYGTFGIKVWLAKKQKTLKKQGL